MQPRPPSPIRRLDTAPQEMMIADSTERSTQWYSQQGHASQTEEAGDDLYPSSFERILQSDYAKRLIDLSPSDTRLIKDLAVNITANGRDLNLWDILDAVNTTVRTRPHSRLAGLLDRFYDNYLAENKEEFLNHADHNRDNEIYKKSLSSLVFLSFGIFLLNSVNDVLATGSGGRSFGGGGSSPNAAALNGLLVGDLPGFVQTPAAAGHTQGLNDFMRLGLNLMKVSQDSRQLDCVWKLYCSELNELASGQGMTSTVARINSVGFKVVLDLLPADMTAAGKDLVRSLHKWKNLDCDNMFQQCSNANS